MVTTAISLPSQALALSPPEVSQRAKAFVVRIDGTIPDAMDLASGSIIGKNDDLYQVLTVWHAVDDGPGVSYYRITTSDGKTHAIVNYTRLDGSTNVDLVLLVFRSDQNYAVAKLGSSQNISEGKTVHYAGYPAVSPRLYRFQGSEQILSVMPMARVVNLGYMVFHSGELVGGMSGGPLLDNEARIIGVFGQGETTIEGGATLKSIPIDLAKQLAQQQNIALVTPPRSNPTPAPSPAPPATPTPRPTPTPSPAPPATPTPRPTPTPAPTLVSQTTGVDYTPLRRLLQAGEWKQADQKTLDLMLVAANRVDARWLDSDSLEQFSCEDLRIIDREWADASNGKFGFAAQKRVWEEVGSPGEWDYSTEQQWRRMYIRLGLKTAGWQENSELGYLDYSELFSLNSSASAVFPVADLQLYASWGEARMFSKEVFYFFSRVANCRL
jgi:hypothetical protein